MLYWYKSTNTDATERADVKVGGKAHKIFEKASFGDKCVFKTFDEMKHGWVNRGVFCFARESVTPFQSVTPPLDPLGVTGGVTLW